MSTDPKLVPAYLTFLLNVPLDLATPNGATIEALERTTTAAQIQSTQSLQPELHVATRFVFRSIPEADSDRGTKLLDAFDDFWHGLTFVDSGPARTLLRIRPRATAVAATHGLVVEERDGRGTISEPQLTASFEAVLGHLNEFLTMLGFVRQDPEVGPIRRTDLPAQVPVVVDTDVMRGLPRNVELVSFQVHTFNSAPASEAQLLDAHDLAFRDRASPWAFGSVVSILQRAYRDAYNGDYGQSVIALGTTMELLTETVIAEVCRARGDDDERIERILGCGLTNLLRDHLAPLLAANGADPDAPERWITDAYQLRKRVVHEGYTPTHNEAKAARHRTVALAGQVSQALRGDPRLATLADQLPIPAAH